ncbi:MAG TPA: SDR family oxidoreductase [Anaerolineae bacterium]|nr:SDR family oxidoreductase [Anaerolineae bacterium]HMR64689.1 SDR family oxidoreductase [Anaerolineae bacterium]
MTNQAVVITGASSGIGRVCALHLDQLGLRVFAGVRKMIDAAALQRAASPHLTPIYIDVQDEGSIKAAAAVVTDTLAGAGLTGLVNNAGIALGGPLEFLPLETWRTQLDINVVGQIGVTQAFLPLLRQGRGRIVNMSSISGRVAMPFFGPYTTSKFALEAITDVLRLELKPWGIDVIAIEPGAIATPIWDKSLTKADQMVAALPPEGQRLYGPALARLRRSVQKTAQGGVPPEKVAEAVAHALLAKRPRVRYLVGSDARLAARLIWLLPDRWRDWLIMHMDGSV